MRHVRRFVATAPIMLLILILAACADSRAEHTPQPPPLTATPTIPPTDPEALAQLQQQHARLKASHGQVAAIWEALAVGQNVPCSAPLQTVDPASVTLLDDPVLHETSALLRDAAVDLNQAANLWRAECTHPRTTIPADVIDRGRLASRAAGAALSEAERLLAEAS